MTITKKARLGVSRKGLQEAARRQGQFWHQPIDNIPAAFVAAGSAAGAATGAATSDKDKKIIGALEGLLWGAAGAASLSLPVWSANATRKDMWQPALLGSMYGAFPHSPPRFSKEKKASVDLVAHMQKVAHQIHVERQKLALQYTPKRKPFQALRALSSFSAPAAALGAGVGAIRADEGKRLQGAALGGALGGGLAVPGMITGAVGGGTAGVVYRNLRKHLGLPVMQRNPKRMFQMDEPLAGAILGGQAGYAGGGALGGVLGGKLSKNRSDEE